MCSCFVHVVVHNNIECWPIPQFEHMGPFHNTTVLYMEVPPSMCGGSINFKLHVGTVSRLIAIAAAYKNRMTISNLIIAEHVEF